MGEIVGALGMSHILAKRSAAESQAENVFSGLKETGQRVAGCGADVILFLVCDHMANFGTALETPFAVGATEHYVSLGDMDLPKMDVRGAPAFARALVASVAQQGFDLGMVREYRPDHGLMIPRLFVDPEGTTPIVPLNININMDPAPSPRRCWALGQAIGRAIAEMPGDQRVLVVATGGLSHWILKPEMGRVNAKFDRQCLDAIASGDAGTLANLSIQELEAQAGNGGVELVTWLCMAGTVWPNGGTVVFYEPMEAWLTGMGGIVMHTGNTR